MKPGRELDALVAEKVMGWHKQEMSSYSFVAWFDSDNKQTGWTEEPDDYDSLRYFKGVAMASDFLTRPVTETMNECTRPTTKQVVRYDSATEEFGVLGTFGDILTYFIPVPGSRHNKFATNLEYWRDSCTRK